MDWGTQSPLKKEKFDNNGEILSKSRYHFFELFQFYFIFHYLLCSRYFVRCYLQKQDFLYKPPIWFTLRYFEFSHNFNVFLKLLIQMQSRKVTNFQNRFQNRFRKELFSMCRLGQKTALKIFKIWSVLIFSWAIKVVFPAVWLIIKYLNSKRKLFR